MFEDSIRTRNTRNAVSLTTEGLEMSGNKYIYMYVKNRNFIAEEYREGSGSRSVRPGQLWEVVTANLGSMVGGLWTFLFSLQLVISAKSIFETCL